MVQLNPSWAGLGPEWNVGYSASCFAQTALKEFKLVIQLRQKTLRAYCPNMYMIVYGSTTLALYFPETINNAKVFVFTRES